MRSQALADGIAVRVVSMPCAEAFDRQDACLSRRRPAASAIPRVAIEAGVSGFWY
jgi:transketolase